MTTKKLDWLSEMIAKRGHGLVKTEEDAKSEVRIWLRSMFESDLCVREIIEYTKSKDDTRSLLLEVLEGKSDDSILPGILDELLDELDRQKESEPGLYLVNVKNGKSVMKLRKDAIYHPPDYIGEDGIKRRAKPVLHPGISAPLTLMMHEESKLSLIKENPKLSKATNAIFDPNSIIRDAEERLREMNYEVGPISEGTIEDIEIGREYYDPLQSMNSQFHRHSAFGAILSKKITGHVSGSRKYEFISIVMEKNSKQRWYRVSFKHA